MAGETGDSEGINVFFDNYAIIELIRGNLGYARYIQEDTTLTIFNFAEIYCFALNLFDEKYADEVYEKYGGAVVEIDDNVLKEAMKFRKQHKVLNYDDGIWVLEVYLTLTKIGRLMRDGLMLIN